MPSSTAAADLGADEVAPAPRVDVEVVGGRGAAAEGQLGQPDPRREVGGLLVEPATSSGYSVVSQLEERRLGGGPMSAGEVLVDVVVGVDQPRRDQAAVGPEDVRRGGGLVAGPAHRAHQPVGDGDPAAGDLAPVGVDRRHQLGPRHQQVDRAGIGFGGAHRAGAKASIMASTSARAGTGSGRCSRRRRTRPPWPGTRRGCPRRVISCTTSSGTSFDAAHDLVVGGRPGQHRADLVEQVLRARPTPS